MHLHELLGWEGPMTHRQFLAWQEWLGGEYDRPERDTYYLMQVAAEIRLFRLMFSQGGGKKVKLEDFLLDFGGKKKKRRPQSAEEVKSILAAHGMRVPGKPPPQGRRRKKSPRPGRPPGGQ